LSVAHKTVASNSWSRTGTGEETAMSEASRRPGWWRLPGLAVAVGAGAGAAGIALRLLVDGVTWLAAGTTEYGPVGRSSSGALAWLGPLFLVCAPVLGGLGYGWFVHRFAPGTRIVGVPEVMLAVAGRGEVRPRTAAVRTAAAAVCLGTGGSIGREGPTVAAGAAIAVSLGRRAGLPVADVRVLIACGAAAATAAVFDTPVAAVVFALELFLAKPLLSGHPRTASLLAVSAVVAAGLRRLALGGEPFVVPAPGDLDLVLVCGLGVVGGLVGAGFGVLLHRTVAAADRFWRWPPWLRPAAGGLPIGLLLLALPQLYGAGHVVIGAAFAGALPLALLLALTVGKIVATSLTLAAGGVGGVFAPLLFVGATLGAAWGTVTGHAAGYALVGSAAVLAGAARVPVTSAVFVVELTGFVDMALPLLAAAVVAACVGRVVSPGTIFIANPRSATSNCVSPTSAGRRNLCHEPAVGTSTVTRIIGAERMEFAMTATQVRTAHDRSAATFDWPRGFDRIPDADWARRPVEEFGLRYDSVGAHTWYKNLEPTVAQVLAALGENKLLVDYSSGTGILAGRLLANVEYPVGILNVDASPKFLRVALENFRQDERVAFRLLNYLKAERRLQLLDEVVDGPLLDRGADVITSTNAIHLYHNLAETLQSWARVLRPGGLTFTGSANLRNPLRRPGDWIIDETVAKVNEIAAEVVASEPAFERYRETLEDSEAMAGHARLREKVFVPVRPLDEYLDAFSDAGLTVLHVFDATIYAQVDEWCQLLHTYHDGVLSWVGGSPKVDGRTPDDDALADRRFLIRYCLEKLFPAQESFPCTWTYITCRR
jgi:H+/Cl- antiporter ClcA/SAM-dependent methyltransferase